MWARHRTSNKDKQIAKQSPKSPNVNEEYLSAVRTKSYADFCLKVQPMVKNETPSPPSSEDSFSETLLDPGQETITSILESWPVPIFSRNSSDLKSLLSNFFHVSAQASEFCSQLLKSLNQVQSDYTFIHQIIDAIDGHNSSSDQFGSAVSNLHSCVVLNNPFSDLNRRIFDQFQNQHSTILQHLKTKRKRIAKRIKLIKCFDKASGVCLTIACGLAAATAMFLAVHTCTVVLMGPALFIVPIKPLKKKIRNLKLTTKCGFLQKAVDQLDVAAKGAYILNRDFDTMSRLVARLGDEVEHNKELIRLFLERRDRVPLQMVEELKKYESGFRKQMEELEEHVYLCLVTINRARALVVKEMN